MAYPRAPAALLSSHCHFNRERHGTNDHGRTCVERSWGWGWRVGVVQAWQSGLWWAKTEELGEM